MGGVRQSVWGLLVALVLALGARDVTESGRLLAAGLALGCVVVLAAVPADPA